MIFSTITQEFLKLNVDITELPAQFSNNIELKFVQDEVKFDGYIPSVYASVFDTKFIECSDVLSNGGVLPIENGIFKISNKILYKDGFLAIGIILTKGDENVSVGPVIYKINANVGGLSPLPPDEGEWQQVVTLFVSNYLDKWKLVNLEPVINNVNEAINTANTASQNANEALDTSNQTNELINSKLESGELKGEPGKSILYGEGVPTDEIGNVGDMYVKTSGDEPYPFYAFFKTNEGWMPSIKMQGVDGTDTLPIEAHVFYPEDMPLPDGYEVDECTLPADIIECNNGLNVEQMFNRPKQLLINNDFQINQRGKNQYNFNSETFGLDCWQHRQGSYYNAIIVTQIDGGGCHVQLGTDAGAGLRQYVASSESCLGKPYTAVISIDGVVYKGTVKMRTTNDPDYTGAISNDRFGVFVFYDEANKYIVYSLWVPEGNKEFDINYVDLFEGNIVYPHVKEDCAIALQECQNRVIVYNEVMLPCNFSYIDKNYDSISANLYLPTNFKGQPNISYDTKEMRSQHGGTTYTDFTIAAKRLYGVNIIRIIWKKDSGTFPDTIKDAYVYVKNLVISCELTL